MTSVKKTAWLEEVMLVLWMCMLSVMMFVPDCAARGASKLPQAPQLPQCSAAPEGDLPACGKCKSSKKTLAQTTERTIPKTTPRERTDSSSTFPSPRYPGELGKVSRKSIRGDGGYCSNNCSCGCNEGMPCECHTLKSPTIQQIPFQDGRVLPDPWFFEDTPQVPQYIPQSGYIAPQTTAPAPAQNCPT